MTENSLSRLLSLAEVAEREDQPGFGYCSAVTVNSADFLKLMAVAKAAKDLGGSDFILRDFRKVTLVDDAAESYDALMDSLVDLEQE